MSGRKRVPDDERQRIREAFAAGMSCKAIGLLHGCSDKTVRRIVSEDPNAPRKMHRYREGSAGVDTTEIATPEQLRRAGLRRERPIPRCQGCGGEGHRDFGRGRVVCGECEGWGYVRPERRRRRA